MVIKVQNLRGTLTLSDPLYIINVYLPPDDTTFHCKTCNGDYFSALEQAIVEYSPKGHVCVMGDFNARTGAKPDFPDNDILSDIIDDDNLNDLCSDIKNFDRSNRTTKDAFVTNRYGNLLLNLCKSSGLQILNGRVNSKNTFHYTREGSTGSSVIDYALLRNQDTHLVQNMQILQGIPDSDHKPIQLSLNLNPKTLSATDKGQPYTYYKYNKESDTELHNKLNQTLNSSLFQNFAASINDNDNPEIAISEFYNCM